MRAVLIDVENQKVLDVDLNEQSPLISASEFVRGHLCFVGPFGRDFIFRGSYSGWKSVAGYFRFIGRDWWPIHDNCLIMGESLHDDRPKSVSTTAEQVKLQIEFMTHDEYVKWRVAKDQEERNEHY